jgi:hypothetical protein
VLFSRYQLREADVSRGEFLTPAEIADLFSVDPKTVTRWAKAGVFPEGTIVRTPGGHRRYYEPAVRAYAAKLGYRPEMLAER